MHRPRWQYEVRKLGSVAQDLPDWRCDVPVWHMTSDIDHRLLALLRQDGRQTVSRLAQSLGVARATVRARMAALERSGEVLGFTVLLRADTSHAPVRGVMMVEVEGRAADRAIDTLRGFPEVSAIHTTNGKWDLLLEIGAESLAALDSVLRRIRLIQGITGSETNLLLASPYVTTPRRTA